MPIVVCYSGSLAEGERVLKPLRSFGSPVADLVKPMKYVETQSIFDEAYPSGRLHYWKSNLVRSLSDDAIRSMVECAEERPSPLSALVLQQMHGAASRVPASETAFAHRHEQYDLLIVSQWSDPRHTEANVKWAQQTWERLQPSVKKSVYVNDLGDEGQERVKAAYGPNYERLASRV